MSPRAAFACLGLLLGLTGCNGAEPEGEADGSRVVARVRGEAVRAAELDAPLRLRLYELDVAKYELRRARVAQLAAERLARASGAVGPGEAEARLAAGLAEGEVEILLEPPERPRVDVDAPGAPWRGAPDAPVTLMVFCDYESVHCQRIQPVLRRLLNDYGDRVRIAHRDHPLPFHRNAREAAEATRCAGEQPDGFWRYHDALYLDPQRLDRARLTRLASTLGLDRERFESCLDEGRTRGLVAADAAVAARLGLRNAPVTFVNGLYLKGPAPEATFRELIDGELRARGISRREPAGTDEAERGGAALPLTLVGTVVSGDPDRALATLESDSWRGTRVFAPGEEVLDGATLERVEKRRVQLRRADGRRETLTLQPGRGAGAPPAPDPSPPREAGGVLQLDREQVDRALEPRAELERRLSPGRLDVQGQRLLKLGEVEPGSLYEMLGLEPGDVILQVDGRFVHDEYNPLWEALRSQGRVTVTVMRKGFPRIFEYAIE